MNLIKLSVRRPVLVAMFMSALVGLGIFCYLQLPMELFPDVEFPVVTVVTRYEGAGPEEIEQLITKELEEEISTVEGIKHLNSISQQGLSLVMAEFYLETDVDVAAADVRAKVDLVRERLPEDAEDPVTQKFDFNAQPMMILSVSAPRSLREVFFIADERIKDRLATVPEVASVNLVGGQEREIHVLASQQRLRAYGLSITDVLAAVANANLETPGGHIRQNSREYNIRLRGKFTSLEEIRDLRIPARQNQSIYLRDIAEVRDTYKEMRDMVRADGQACVGMTIQKRAGGNIVAIHEAILEKIEELRSVLPPDFRITVQDEQAPWITSAVENVRDDMISGIILASIVLLIFLHSFRNVLIISLAIPISVLATFIIMFLGGFTLNMMSLMGLAMTTGLLVDNVILGLENMTRYLHLDYSPEEAAEKGSTEIALAVASTTLANVVVFVPIAFMGGIIGQFFKDLGLTATISSVVSFFISFTLAPMMAAKLLTKANTTPKGTGPADRFAKAFDRQFDGLKNAYGHALHWVLHHRIITLGIVGILFIGSLKVAGYIGGEFITNMDQGKFILTVEMPTGTRLEETDRAVQKLETLLRNPENLPELVGTYASVGSIAGEWVGGSSQAVNIAQINVTLTDKSQRSQSTEKIMNRLRPVIAQANLPGARIKLLESGGGGGAEAAIMMDITSDNMDHLKAFAEEAVAIISNEELVPGAVDIDTNFRQGQPEIRIIPDREKCRDAQVDTRFLSQVVAATFEGLLISEYREGAYNYDIRVKADENSRRQLTDIADLSIMNSLGKRLPLPEIAAIEYTTGPSQLFRKDRLNQITVSCDNSSRSPAEIVRDIEKNMAPLLAKYPDCRIFFAGSIEMMEESFGRLFVALVMAVCLTYMVLASLLESFLQPLIIMFAVPLSLIGVFVGLFLTGGTFSIFSIMSLVILVGMVINNSIIVIDYINILRREGNLRLDAIVEAGTVRLRPIIMANLTSIVSLLPLALGLGWGGEMRAPMAMVQIGGLVVGGWLGLLIVPVVYTLNDDFVNFLKRKFRRNRHDSTAANSNAES